MLSDRSDRVHVKDERKGTREVQLGGAVFKSHEERNRNRRASSLLQRPVEALFPMRPRIALFFMFFPSQRLDANPLRTSLTNRAFRSLATYIAHVIRVFGSRRPLLDGIHVNLLSLPNADGFTRFSVS
jgi:hypothetical protein